MATRQTTAKTTAKTTAPATTSEPAAETSGESTGTQDEVVLATQSDDSAVDASDAPEAEGEVGEDTRSDRVKALDEQLEALKDALSVPGDEPKHFYKAARLNSDITKFIIKNPKDDVMDAYFKFLEDNKDGVAAPDTFMRGSTGLTTNEERELGFLYNLFFDLVRGEVARISAGTVVQHLRKQEIVTYYNRRMNAIIQNKA